ncbi:hypothetical protein LCGC14_1782860 [marine sediment metagenome]|uniref:Peptidase M20 dimerisation domain-containing protein n=1 Tax=marine sediment metagenome TaxID=412755 RepID=A0A0F9GUZ7_9ZZZZ|nr:MAG: N-formyl-4-amino-5-aminomethyl-2-methylpyrimidine deformylase [Candidatus Lokiarchaeum sp. GC14_75]
MSENLILEDIEENKEEYIDFLKDLIQTESYNPPGNEKNVALVIENYLKDVGVNCDVFPFGNNRANLFATLNDNYGGRNLIYNGHMDVVPPGSEEEWKYPPLSATVKRRKIFGRGAVDMKSGLAAMTIALKILKKLNLELPGNLILNGVADEEQGGYLGTNWLIENKLQSIKADFTIVGEPSGLNPLPKAIILGEKGRVEIKIVTNGISGHASVSSLGKNAIYMMSELIQNLDQMKEHLPKSEPPLSLDELKEMMSVAFPSQEIFNKILNEQPILQDVLKANIELVKNLTMIKGGIKPNVIPDLCEAVIDFRLLPNQTTEMVLDALKNVIKNLGYQIKNQPTGAPEEVFVYLEVLSETEASYWNDWRDSKILKDFYTTVEKIYKKKPFYFFFPAGADASFYRNNGYCKPTIMFGPGVASTAHAVNEYIEIQDYINSIKVYTLFACKFLENKLVY